MLDAVRNYLLTKNLSNIYLDIIPDYKAQPECIALFCWQKTPASMHDGSAAHRIQIQVRRKTTGYADAMTTCQTIADLLDSGESETTIPLTGMGSVIGRMTSAAAIMPAGRTESTVTVYAEVVLFGNLAPAPPEPEPDPEPDPDPDPETPV